MLRNPGTIHQDVHTAKFANRCVHHGKDVLGNRDIRLQGNGPPSRFTYSFGRALRILDVETTSGYVAAEFREAKRNHFPKSHSSPGDECDASAEVKQFSEISLLNIHVSNLRKPLASYVSANLSARLRSFE